MELTAIPLAFIAGLLSILSPCVLPMLPAVTAASMNSNRAGLLSLALGLSLSFALAGTVLTFVLLSLGISTEWLRYFSITLMILMGLALVIPQLNDKLSFMLSRLTSNAASQQWQGDSVAMQLVIGASLGLVWLPCVGPTLGTAIALASTGQSIPLAFIVMLTFGFGTALPLIIIGYMSAKQFSKIGNIAAKSKYILGITLILLGLAILTGIDRELEKLALSILPDFITEI